MKILLVSSSSGSHGGGEIYLLNLARVLAERGHTVRRWGSDHPRMDEIAASFAHVCEVQREPYRNTYDYRFRPLAHLAPSSEARQIVNSWTAFAPDVLHLNKQNLEDGLDLVTIAGRAGIPSLCTIHITQTASFLKARGGRVRDWIARRILKRYRGTLVAVSEQRAKDLRDFLPAADIEMVDTGAPLSPPRTSRTEMRDRLNVPSDARLLICVGRMARQKRPLLFLDRAREILKLYPETHFLWVGDGELTEEWDRFVRTWQLESRVQRLPWTNDVSSCLHAADACLHMAEYEGLPLALIEAMAAGLPCIVSESLLQDMPEFLRQIAVPAPDTGPIPDILGDDVALARVGQLSRTAYRDHCSPGVMGEQYAALYRRLLVTR